MGRIRNKFNANKKARHNDGPFWIISLKQLGDQCNPSPKLRLQLRK